MKFKLFRRALVKAGNDADQATAQFELESVIDIQSLEQITLPTGFNFSSSSTQNSICCWCRRSVVRFSSLLENVGKK